MSETCLLLDKPSTDIQVLGRLEAEQRSSLSRPAVACNSSHLRNLTKLQKGFLLCKQPGGHQPSPHHHREDLQKDRMQPQKVQQQARARLCANLSNTHVGSTSLFVTMSSSSLNLRISASIDQAPAQRNTQPQGQHTTHLFKATAGVRICPVICSVSSLLLLHTCGQLN